MNFFRLILYCTLICLTLKESWSQTVISGEIYDGNGGPLTLAGSPYLNQSGINVPAGKTLTIEPGVVIRFANAQGFEILGNLIAEGLPNSRIIFTKDTGNAAWVQLLMRQSSEASLKYCNFEYGGLFGFPMINLQSPKNLTAENCSFKNSLGSGLSFGSNWDQTSANIKVDNCVFENNLNEGLGIRVGDTISVISITGNTFRDNKQSAMVLSGGIYPVNSTFQGNGFDGIQITFGNAVKSGIYECDLLIAEDIIIPQNITVGFLPGLKILFDQNSIEVFGKIDAQGTQSSRIIFKRKNDDIPWNWILFRQFSAGKFKYCDFDGGGPSGGFPMILVQSPKDLEFDFCNFQRCRADGIGGSIGISTGRLAVSNSNFTANYGSGLNLIREDSAESVLIENNFFNSNRKSAMVLSGGIYPAANRFDANGFNGIEFNNSANSIAKKSGRYDNDILVNDCNFTINNGTQVILSPGITVYINSPWSGSVSVSGELTAEGTETENIRFLPYNTGIPWRFLNFYQNSKGSLKFCEFQNGGAGQSVNAMMSLNDPTDFKIENCIFMNSSSSGIEINCGLFSNSNITVQNSAIFDNEKNGLVINKDQKGTLKIECNDIIYNLIDGISSLNGNYTLSGNKIEKNGRYGLSQTAFQDTLIAENNWWGDPSGPSGIGPGKGDTITERMKGSVDFEPWATTPTFFNCGDSALSGDPPVITSVNPDTLNHGNEQIFYIKGRNFHPEAVIYMTRGNRPGENPGDIQANFSYISYGLIVVEFDLTNPAISNGWDIVVRNPNQTEATKEVYIYPSIILPVMERRGVIGYPVGNWRTNYLDLYNIGNDDGYILLTVSPPAPGLINLKAGSNELAWDSQAESNKNVCNLLVNVSKSQPTSIFLSWHVPPENVNFPVNDSLKIMNNILGGEDKLEFGGAQTLSYKGLKGATKSQIKSMIVKSIVKVGCGALADLIVGNKVNANLNKAINDVMKSVPNGFSETPEWFLKKIADKLTDLIPGVKYGKMILDCIDRILGAFFNELETATKDAADRIRSRAPNNAEDAAMDAIEKNVKTGNQFAYHSYTKSGGLLDKLNEPPCNPGPAEEVDEDGNIRAAWDPNNKDAFGEFATGFFPPDDTSKPIFQVSSKDLDKPINYIINFENKAEATDSATDIFITDTLDASLDLTSIRIDTARSAFKTGKLTWNLTNNVLSVSYKEIMLPPNKVPPEGQWQFAYTIKPKNNLALGTIFTNKASIVFDFNPPILTPTVSHIVGAPKLALSESAIEFGVQPLNSQTIKTVWARNIGDYPLDLDTAIGLSKPFRILSDNYSGQVLNTNDSALLVLAFTPEVSSAYRDTLNLYSSDLRKNPFKIILKGSGPPSDYIETQPNSSVYKISGNSPNPFYSSTYISYNLQEESFIKISIFNFCGDLLKVLVDLREEAGSRTVEWDGMNAEGKPVPTGTYFYETEIKSTKNPKHTLKQVKSMLKIK